MKEKAEEFFKSLNEVTCTNECKFFFINEDNFYDCTKLESLWENKLIRYFGTNKDIELCPFVEEIKDIYMNNILGKFNVLKENPILPEHIEKLVDWSVCPPIISLKNIPNKETYNDILKLIESGDLILKCK